MTESQAKPQSPLAIAPEPANQNTTLPLPTREGAGGGSPPATELTIAPFRWTPPERIARRRLLLNDHAARGFVSGTVAPGGVGKTALVLAECLSLATGADIFETGSNARANVWYIGLEDPLEEYRRRVAAAALLHKLDTRAIEQGFFLNVGTNNRNFVMTERTAEGTDLCRPVVASLMASIVERDIALVVVDPFVASHRANESDNMTIATLVRAWSHIAEKTGAAIELVHHTRKGAGEREPSADDARGASSLVNALRSVRMLVPMSEAEAIAGEVYEPERYFRVAGVKANLSTRARPPEWREIVGVCLGNGEGEAGAGDKVGAVRLWTPPQLATDEQLEAIKAKLSGGQYRLDVRSPDWAGKPIAEVLGVDIRDVDARAKIRRAIRMWVGEGELRVEERMDEHRYLKNFVQAALSQSRS